MVRFALLILLLAAAASVQAMNILYPTVPLKRVVDKLSADIQAHPDDPAGYYCLGRTYYLAFRFQVRCVRYYPTPSTRRQVGMFSFFEGEQQRPNPINLEAMHRVFPGYDTMYEVSKAQIEQGRTPKDVRKEVSDQLTAEVEALQQSAWEPEPLSRQEALDYAAKARENLNKALALDPENLMFQLALADLLFHGLRYCTDNNISTQLTEQQVFDAYWKVFERARDDDLSGKWPGANGSYESVTSHYAGSQCLKLKAPTPEQHQEIEAHLKSLHEMYGMRVDVRF